MVGCSISAVPARDMLVHRDSSLVQAREVLLQVREIPVLARDMLATNAEMLDMQSALQQRSDATVWRELK